MKILTYLISITTGAMRFVLSRTAKWQHGKQ